MLKIISQKMNGFFFKKKFQYKNVAICHRYRSHCGEYDFLMYLSDSALTQPGYLKKNSLPSVGLGAAPPLSAMSGLSFIQASTFSFTSSRTFLGTQQVCNRHGSTPLTKRVLQSREQTTVHQRCVPAKMMSETGTGTGTEADSLGLPPKLRRYVDTFAIVPDPKLRYQQLLFLAKELPSMDDTLKVDDNRVYGCTSVVHVHVSVSGDGCVQLQGDSDSQLTKGLLALLVNGLEGCKPADVQDINSEFISYSGLATSLTPSRNNGFVSMLAKIKEQVARLSQTSPSANSAEGEATSSASSGAADHFDDPSRPIYSALVNKLNKLKPVKLTIVDNSAQHAGHAGSKGLNGESHFAVSIVSDAFEGLKLVQRHRLIYTLMNEEMSAGHIHALQIDAKTSSEVE